MLELTTHGELATRAHEGIARSFYISHLIEELSTSSVVSGKIRLIESRSTGRGDRAGRGHNHRWLPA
jgi:hypothetical protein